MFSQKQKMFSSTRKVYTSYDNIKCVKKLWLIRAPPTSRPHIHIAFFCDTPGNPDAFFHDLVCLCACRDYPKVEQKLQCFSDRMASILLNRKQKPKEKRYCGN